ncbi:YbaB/EbfC family nucleoid-associated protein [Tessaracoccus sp. Y36]
MSDFPRDALDSPQLRELMALAEATYTGHSQDGSATAVVDGGLSVLSTDAGPVERPAQAGTALVQAINDALANAERDIENRVESGSLLSPQLRAVFETGVLPDDDAPPVGDVLRTFEGAADDGAVVIQVDARTRRLTACYVQDVRPENLAQVPAAANRALASSQVGRDDAQPLSETLDKLLSHFDTDMTALEGRLTAVDDQLNEILRRLN